jgi:hypothetical protein
MKFDLGDVLARMWKIGWNHKVLWLWQFLPGLLAFLMIPIMFLGNPAFMTFLPEPFNRFADEFLLVIVFTVLMFIFLILSMFVSVLAQTATIHGALKVEKGAEKLAFREMFNESKPYFWRVLGLYMIFFGAWFVIIFGVSFVLGVGAALTFGIATFCFVPFFILLIPVMIVGYSVLELAQAAIIADDMGAMDAISHGWRLFRGNALGVILLMLILYFGLYLISSAFSLPLAFPMMLMPLGIDSQGNFNNFMMLFFLILFPVMILVMSAVQAILMAFFQSAWAVVYLRLRVVEANA